jgi:hypothetical protein
MCCSACETICVREHCVSGSAKTDLTSRRIPECPGAQPAHPDLAIALARPGEDPGGTCARVLASVAARGHKTGWPVSGQRPVL